MKDPINFLKSLGWESKHFWNNRLFMSLGSQVICVHNDECYLTTKSGIRYDKKLDKKGIREFTKLIVNLKNILANLENYSAYDYVEACKSVALFITKYNHQKY